MFNYNLFGGPLFEEFGLAGVSAGPFARDDAALDSQQFAFGVIVGLWHAPLFVFKLEQFFTVDIHLIVVGLSILMAQAFNSSGRSVVVAILSALCVQCSSRFIDPFLDGTLTRERPSPEMFVAFAFWTLGVLAVLFTRGRLNAQTRQASW